MGNNVTVDIQGRNQKLKGSLDDSENMVKRFGSTVKGVFVAIGAAMAARQVFHWAAGFLQAAGEAEEAETTLAAALDATGHAAGFQLSQLVKLSDQLQKVTKYEAETTQGAMTILATFRNVRGDQFIEATKAAQDMSTILGGDLSSSAMQLGKALNDPVAGISALTRSGVSFTESQKATIKVLAESGDIMGAQKIILAELANEFGGAAEKVGAKYTGKIEQAKNRMGDMAEDLGGILIDAFILLEPILTGAIRLTEMMIETVSNLAKEFEGSQTDVSGLGKVLEWFLDAAVTVYTGFEFLIERYDLLGDKMVVSFKLTYEQIVNNMKHVFSEVIPKWLGYFTDIWRATWTDADTNITQVLKNINKNIVGFFNSSFNFKTMKLDFEATSLFDNLKSTVVELPEIAAREIGKTEKKLSDEMSKLNDKISSDFGRRFNYNKRRFLEMFKGETDEALDMANTASDEYDKIDEKLDEKKEEEKAEERKEEREKHESLAGGREDLEGLNRRISEAAAKVITDIVRPGELAPGEAADIARDLHSIPEDEWNRKIENQLTQEEMFGPGSWMAEIASTAKRMAVDDVVSQPGSVQDFWIRWENKYNEQIQSQNKQLDVLREMLRTQKTTNNIIDTVSKLY